MALGRLSVILDANIAKFESDLGRASRVAQAQSRQMQQSFERAGKAIGLALGAGLATLGVSVKKSIDDMLQLNALSKQVGMPVDQFTALSAVAKRADLDVQSFAAAMTKADKALTEAQSGKGAAAAAFKALGIDPKQVKDNNDLILKSADALSKYKDGIGKTAVEMAIFGKSGAQLNAFLDQGSASIQAQAEHMKELGVAFGPDAQAQLAAYDNAHKELTDTIDGLRNKLALALLPSLQSAAEYLGDFVKSMDKGSVSGFTEVVNTLARAAIVLGGAFVTAGHAIGATLAAASRAGHALFFETDIRHPIDSFKALGSAFSDTKNIFKEFGADTGAQWKKLAAQVTDFGDKAAKATAKATGGDAGRKTLNFDPTAGTGDNAAKIKALAAAYDALAVAAQKANEKQLTPQGKALADYTNGVRELAKLAGDYIAKGGDAAKVQELFLQGKAGLWQQYTRAVQAAAAADKEFSAGLKHQLDLQRQAIDIEVASIGMGSKAADRLRQRNALEQQGADAIRQLTLERDKYLSTDPQYQVLTKHIQEQAEANAKAVAQMTDGFNRQDAAAGNWHNGFTAALDDFSDRMKNTAQQMKDFTNQFIDGFGNAFVQFAMGTQSASKAFGSFVDQMLANAMRWVADKAMQKLLDWAGGSGGSSGNSGSGWGGLVSAFAGLFGGGKASGGAVAAGGMYQVNERGPELLSVGGRDFLMMGSQGGTVTPNSRLGGGSQVINVNVQPTSSQRTASQIAQAVARKQQLAMARA